MGDTRVRRSRWLVPAVLALSTCLVASCTSEPDQSSEPPPNETSVSTDPIDRSVPPTVGSDRLETVDEASRPPQPTQWSDDLGPVPFGQWWSGLATGPGIPALWAQPLLLRMGDDGRLDLSNPTLTTRADGFRDADVMPAIFFELESGAVVEVVDHGPLHVRFTISTPDTTVTMTMVQGSPFLELEGDGALEMTVPALAALTGAADGSSVSHFSTAAGPWLLASSATTELRTDGDHVTLDLAPGVRHAIGPVPDDADDRYTTAALVVADAELIATTESLTVAADGTVTQVLAQHRQGNENAPVVWSLLPHHLDVLSGGAESIASLASVYGISSVVVTPRLTLEYPAVPIVWNAVRPAGFDATSIDLDDVPDIGIGSYFGAKHTATQAAVHDVLSASGNADAAAPYLAAAEASLGALVTSGNDPQLRWEPGWGSVVVTPAEFGSDEQLNDHQLQNGYWVSAAASVVAADPTQRSLLEEGIDLLVADYAGANIVPDFAGTVADEGTWSAFAGHSWASGVGGFAAGNNLESISESSYAWWAAAKWFLATDRAPLAQPFIARLTIESWLTGYEWLPTPNHQSPEPTTRPWTGVVWAGKADPGTWFDASDEAALGIRLLPVGPQSFSRYPDGAAIRAANDRWDWCDTQGSGCVERWWNLLDTDAVVAGRADLTPGDLPEESTTELVRRWWRAHWEASTVAEGWSCTPGTTLRQTAAGALVALVTNPATEPLQVICRHDSGNQIELTAEARGAALVPVE